MLPPVNIPELDPAGPVDYANDLLLIRQGLNDKKITPANLVSVKLESYPSLNRSLIATDVLLVGVNNGGGAYSNYTMDPRRVGFLPGVVMWFYTNTAPLYWQIDPSLGDRVLAVQGGGQAYANTGLNGTWQQANAFLTITQIPGHSHYVDTTVVYPGSGSSSSTKVSAGLNGGPHRNYVPTFPTGGFGSTKETSSGNNDAPSNVAPVSEGHNHGSLWRPAAAIGVCCLKSG